MSKEYKVKMGAGWYLSGLFGTSTAWSRNPNDSINFDMAEATEFVAKERYLWQCSTSFEIVRNQLANNSLK